MVKLERERERRKFSEKIDEIEKTWWVFSLRKLVLNQEMWFGLSCFKNKKLKNILTQTITIDWNNQQETYNRS